MRKFGFLISAVLIFASILSFQNCSGMKASFPEGTVPQISSSLGFKGTISYAAKGSDGYSHVYLLNSSGVITPLTSGAHNDETPEWSADGSKIVFQRSDSSGIAVYVMNADGSNLKRLSPTPGKDMLPGFSPDGTKIIFSTVIDPVGCNGGSLPKTSIVVMNAGDGSGRTTLIDASTAGTCFNMEPRLSPNGSSFVYMCGPYNSAVQICKMNTNGTGFAYLTNTSNTTSGDPHWSTDGNKIAISRRDPSGNVNVWTMNADGSNLKAMTTFTNPMEAGDAGWSQDDSFLVFQQDDGGNGQSDPNVPAWLAIVGSDGNNYLSLSVSCSAIGCGPRFKPGL